MLANLHMYRLERAWLLLVQKLEIKMQTSCTRNNVCVCARGESENSKFHEKFSFMKERTDEDFWRELLRLGSVVHLLNTVREYHPRTRYTKRGCTFIPNDCSRSRNKSDIEERFYIYIFVYQGATFHTFQNQAFFSVRTEKRAEMFICWHVCRKVNLSACVRKYSLFRTVFCTRANILTFPHA